MSQDPIERIIASSIRKKRYLHLLDEALKSLNMNPCGTSAVVHFKDEFGGPKEIKLPNYATILAIKEEIENTEKAISDLNDEKERLFDLRECDQETGLNMYQ